MTRALKFHLGCATMLFLFDTFVMDQGGITLLVALIFLVRIFARNWKTTSSATALSRAGLYLACLALVVGVRYANNALATSRMKDVIAAVEAYHSAHAVWPAHLEDAMAVVPRAKFTLLDSHFNYRAGNEGGAFVEFVELAPFGRRFYSFADHRWGSLD